MKIILLIEKNCVNNELLVPSYSQYSIPICSTELLVSHSHRFIYIKTRKTASTSIERYLLPYCKNGIVQLKKAHQTANYIQELVGAEAWESYTKICPIRNPWDQLVSYYHWRSRKRWFGERIKRSLIKGKPFMDDFERMSFEESIFHLIQSDFLNINKYILNNYLKEKFFFIRFEHLQNDLQEICTRLGIEYNISKLPNEKTSHRPSRSYVEYYSAETRKLVEEAYQWEINKFNYKF